MCILCGKMHIYLISIFRLILVLVSWLAFIPSFDMKLYFISLQSSNFTFPFTGLQHMQQCDHVCILMYYVECAWSNKSTIQYNAMPGYISEILVSILFDPNAFIQVYTAGIQTPNLLDVNLLPCPCL